jgi:hypothetical protein
MIGDERRRRWVRLQRQLAGLSPYGCYEVVQDSGHYVQIDRPHAVVDAVWEMLALV